MTQAGGKWMGLGGGCGEGSEEGSLAPGNGRLDVKLHQAFVACKSFIGKPTS
jgi:hypothetical protein